MAETMTMNQVIHAAVRRDLKRLSEALGAAAEGDRARARDLERAYENLHRELIHHHEQEDRLVFPALHDLGVDTSLLRDMDAEHHAMAEALERTTGLMRRYSETAASADAGAARAAVEHAREVVEAHLAHEEQALDPLISSHAETDEWKRVEKQLRKGSPTTTGCFLAWLTDGMDPEAQTYLRSTIPPPVVMVFSKVLGRRYQREVAPVWRSGGR